MLYFVSSELRTDYKVKITIPTKKSEIVFGEYSFYVNIDNITALARGPLNLRGEDGSYLLSLNQIYFLNLDNDIKMFIMFKRIGDYVFADVKIINPLDYVHTENLISSTSLHKLTQTNGKDTTKIIYVYNGTSYKIYYIGKENFIKDLIYNPYNNNAGGNDYIISKYNTYKNLNCKLKSLFFVNDIEDVKEFPVCYDYQNNEIDSYIEMITSRDGKRCYSRFKVLYQPENGNFLLKNDQVEMNKSQFFTEEMPKNVPTLDFNQLLSLSEPKKSPLSKRLVLLYKGK